MRKALLNTNLIFSIILPNIITVLGVLFWKWDLGTLLVLYWIESVIFIFFIFLEILFNQNKDAEATKIVINNIPFQGTFKQYKSRMAVFFVFFFGLFSFVHFIFLIFLVIKVSAPGMLNIKEVLNFAMFIFCSHFVGFILDYTINRAYLRKSISALFTSPIKRVVILHVVIVLSGFVTMKLTPSKSDVPIVLAIFIIVKIVSDLFSIYRSSFTKPAEIIKINSDNY